MDGEMSFEEVVAQLKQIHARGKPGTTGDPELAKILAARDEVVPGYQALFAKENLQKITAEEFRAFLIFRNNQHWLALQRMGPAICEDMERLRKALEILTDETRPIDERMNELADRKKGRRTNERTYARTCRRVSVRACW